MDLGLNLIFILEQLIHVYLSHCNGMFIISESFHFKFYF